jgi:type IV pilus biogenesis protein CpaD/CtpE
MRVQSIPSLSAICGLAASALLASCTTVTAAAAPAPPGPRTEKWIDLQVGECVADLPPADLSRVTVNVVDCATAHLAEVYLRAPMTVNAAVANVANKECAAGFAPYTGRSVDGSPFSITFLIDSNQDRTGPNPTPSTVICLLQAASGQPLTGSAHH